LLDGLTPQRDAGWLIAVAQLQGARLPVSLYTTAVAEQ
jgi:hypothetical protein